MIISDLSHFEEVVAEAPSLLGGIDLLPSTELVLSTLSQLDAQLAGSLDINNLTTSSQITPSVATSTTVVGFNIGDSSGIAAASTSFAS